MIVLFTDFGCDGPYTGQVQARLYQQAPGVSVISLFCDLAPYNVQAAAYLLPAYSAGFPPATVFLCVVDPGVGSARPGVVMKADGRWYVGPNEGLFALLARRAAQLECWQLPDPVGVSSSFHGRDVFAPAAALLATGAALDAEAVPVTCLEQPDWPDDLFRVCYIDRFGNAITGVRASVVDTSQLLSVNGHSLKPAQTFSDVAAGEAFWYTNSNGLVELAVNRGRADQVLGIKVGTVIAL
ncbi:MAG: SAM-dependent chlorinase/fluorinase [Gammaproteobacteria bacterium]